MLLVLTKNLPPHDHYYCITYQMGKVVMVMFGLSSSLSYQEPISLSLCHGLSKSWMLSPQ